MSNFQDILIDASNAANSHVCVGLDPDPELMPVSDIYEFCVSVIDATADAAAAFKPNLAFFEALGAPGFVSMKRVVDYIHNKYPGKIVIGDGKRGDIGSTSAKYAKALFEIWEFDAATVNAYGGYESIEPFLSYTNKGVFLWCKSSNPGGSQFQGDEKTEGNPVFKKMAALANEWNAEGNLGLVVGATYPYELKVVRELAPSVPMLIPGVGSQEGNLEGSVLSAMSKSGANFLINASRSIIYASERKDTFQEASAEAANSLRERIENIIGRNPR
jgi:orotidine-5'-phosphate decarboxylase